MVRKAKHPHSAIEAALQHAEAHGWICVKPGSSSHAWGKLRCPHNDKACRCGQFCATSVWSTPRNPENHARQIRRCVDNCMYVKGSGDDND